jgi:hypothetical protein
MFTEEALKNGSHLRSHVINHGEWRNSRKKAGILKLENKGKYRVTQKNIPMY